MLSPWLSASVRAKKWKRAKRCVGADEHGHDERRGSPFSSTRDLKTRPSGLRACRLLLCLRCVLFQSFKVALAFQTLLFRFRRKRRLYLVDSCDGERQFDRGAFADDGIDAQRAAKGNGPLTHPFEAKTLVAGCRRIETHSIVFHGEPQEGIFTL